MEKSEKQTSDQDQRCQSGQSAKNSVIPSEGDSSKNYGADQQRLQISDLHVDKFPTPATFAFWKIRFKTEVCTCSQFPTEAMHWIKEVEMVNSVDDLRSSSSTRGISMPNFEVLDARIASALNRIIHNSRFKTEVCTCSQFPTEAMHWIKEVEMVDSVDDLISSSSIRGIQIPNFEVLDARIASALNRIIHNSHFTRRISLEERKAQKQDRFIRGRQIDL